MIKKKFNIKMQDLVYGQKFVRAKKHQQIMNKQIMREFDSIESGNLNISKKYYFEML
ncbi:hypothetical protein [Spiroplasma endosymbiont of Labia minor]|uniref:hypothetical protein n=1 Tax=Spiroplasma endosymbiont of Labia minor TaxID=3066305 RepID=UPI0030D3EBD5